MNHKIQSKTLNILALQTGSKNRIRVPVAGVRNTQVIKPGDKIKATVDKSDRLVFTKVQRPRKSKRNYHFTVERDGAIRISASWWGLKSQNQMISCDSMTGTIIFD